MDDAAPPANLQNSVLPNTPPPNLPAPKNKYLNEFSSILARKLLLLAVILIIGIPFISFVLSQQGLFEKGKTMEFELVESSPEDEDGNISTVAQPTFVFSKKIGIAEKDIKKYIQITPAIPGNWHIEKNGQVIYFSRDVKQTESIPSTFAFNSIYKIRIDKKIASYDGQTLKNDLQLTFRTQKNTKGYVTPTKKLVNFFVNQQGQAEFYLDTGNISLNQVGWNVKIQTATVEQFLKYFSHKEGKNSLFHFEQNTGNKTIYNFNTTMLPTRENPRGLSIGFEPMKSAGLYFVTIKNDNLGSEDFFISVTNHINQVFSDENKTYIWTQDYQTGESLPGVLSQFYSFSKNPHLIQEGKTNENGLFSTANKIEKIDFVITRKDNDTAITQINEYYNKQSGESFNVFSYSDRAVYRPGDTVHYKAILRKFQNGTYIIPKNQKVYGRLSYDYDQPRKNYKELTVDENGTVATDFIIPQTIESSYFDIFLYTKNNGKYNQIQTLSLNVSAYRKPDMELTVKTGDEYISKDLSKTSLLLTTLYGKPLTNAGFTYRIIVDDFDEVKDRNLENKIQQFYGGGKELVKGTGFFDKYGKANIEFQSDLLGIEKSQLATIEVTPNIGASPSIGRTQTLIHRGEFALFFENVQSDNNLLKGNILSLDHQNPRSPYQLENLNVSLYKIQNYDYQNKELVGQDKLQASASGTFSFSFPNLSAGDYEIETWIQDKRGNPVTSRYKASVGQNTQPQNVQKYNMAIEDLKEKYKPGETANLTVKSNFPIRNALVIFFNEKQINSIQEIKPNSDNWKFPLSIPKNQDKTLGVEIITAFDKTVIQAQKNIEIDFGEKNLITSLKLSKTDFSPGETIEVQITTKDWLGNPVSADTSLAIIDTAISQIKKHSLDVFGSFYYDRYNFLQVSNSVEGIYIYGPGGGGGGGGGGEETRSNFKDTAYWNPHIKTGDDGNAKVLIKIPDNLTTFVAEIISSSKDSKFGQNSLEFVSKKDVSIIPTIPNYYYRDDKPVISALVQNSSVFDIETTATISIKETGFSKNLPLRILKGQFETLEVPAHITTKNNSVTVSIEIKDNKGKTLDLVLLKKPVLPRENIKTSLESFDHSNSIEFIPKYSGLDFNNLNLTIIPHAASRLFKNVHLDGEPHVTNTQSLYVWSYILSKTKSGLIPPNIYKYAKMKNDFRVAFNYLLTEKMPQGPDIFWYPKYPYSDEGRLTINLWARQAIIQAEEMGMADEVTNVSEIIEKSKTYILSLIKMQTQPPSSTIPRNLNPLSGKDFTLGPPLSIPPEEQTPLKESQKFLLTWFGFDSYLSNEKSLDLAALVLKNSDKESLEKLKKERYLSSDDRIIFDGKTIYSRALPALALIEKGSVEDSQKAIKGLSFSGGYYDDSFVLLAGVKDAIRRGIDLENIGLKITLNGEPVDEKKGKDVYFNEISHSYTSKTDEGLKVNIETLGNFPFYTTSLETQLLGASENKDRLIDQVIKMLSPSEKTNGKIIDTKLSRKYRNIENGQALSNIQEGQSSVVELSFLYPFTSKLLPSYSSLYEIHLTDAISPSLMYLNQVAGNSTQDISVLDKIYPKTNKDKPTPYALPTRYSDQALFFNSTGTGYLNPIFSYVVFGISQGNYFQPKTSAVLPRFGIIIEEK